MTRSYKLAIAAGLVSLTSVGFATIAAAAPTTTYPYMSPTNTSVKATLVSGTDLTATGSFLGSTLTVTCTSTSATAKTPADGLTAKIATPPTISGCTDSLSGTDTVKTKGTWAVSISSTGTKGSLTIPKGGATFTSSFDSSCVLTLAPKAAAKLSGTYSQKTGIANFKDVKVPVSGSSGCLGAVGSAGTLSAELQMTPIVKLVTKA